MPPSCCVRCFSFWCRSCKTTTTPCLVTQICSKISLTCVDGERTEKQHELAELKTSGWLTGGATGGIQAQLGSSHRVACNKTVGKQSLPKKTFVKDRQKAKHMQKMPKKCCLLCVYLVASKQGVFFGLAGWLCGGDQPLSNSSFLLLPTTSLLLGIPKVGLHAHTSRWRFELNQAQQSALEVRVLIIVNHHAATLPAADNK